jgi:hypothetical protein
VLGNLGELLAVQGQTGAALKALEAGERILREVDDPLDLAKLLCMKGRAAFAGGDRDNARKAFAEAQGIGVKLGAESASDLGRQVEALRSLLG